VKKLSKSLLTKQEWTLLQFLLALQTPFPGFTIV